MAQGPKSSAPASFAEGAQGIVAAISAAMTAPDAAPHLPMLDALLKMTVGAIQKQGAGQGAPPGAGAPPGGGPPGGGTNIPQLMGGGGPQPPSAGISGSPSPSGIGSDDLRRSVAAQAGTPG